jgi:hypothetical protein
MISGPLCQINGLIMRKGVFCKSLGGLEIPMVTFYSKKLLMQLDTAPVIVVIAR